MSGDTAAALPSLTDAIDALAATVGPAHVATLRERVRLAEVHVALGARSAASRALDDIRAALGDDAPPEALAERLRALEEDVERPRS